MILGMTVISSVFCRVETVGGQKVDINFRWVGLVSFLQQQREIEKKRSFVSPSCHGISQVAHQKAISVIILLYNQCDLRDSCGCQQGTNKNEY